MANTRANTRAGTPAGTQSDLEPAPGDPARVGPAPADRERDRRQPAIERFALPIVAAVAVLGAALWRWRVGLGNYPLDDAYIVEHSVLGILGDGETRFLDSSPWIGVTSPVYVLLLLPLAAILPMDVAHFVLEVGAITAFAVGCLYLCRALGVRSWLQVALPVLALIVGEVPLQLANGLETGLAMAAIAWLLVAFVRGFPSWGFALAGISPFIRPELAALAGVFVLVACATKRREAIRGVALGAACAAAVAATLVAAGGDLIPGTISAKAYFFAEGCLPLGDKAYQTGRALARFAIAVGPFVIGFALVTLAKFRYAASALVIVILTMYTIRLPGALFHNDSRYLYALVPIAVGGWAAACANDSTRIRHVATAILVATAAVAAVTLPARLDNQIARATDASDAYESVATWVAANVDDDAVVLLHDAGALSLVGEQKLVDLVGLKTPTSSEVHRATTWKACSHPSSATGLIAAAAGASVFVVLDEWETAFGLVESLRNEHWRVERLSPEGSLGGYSVFAISSTP